MSFLFLRNLFYLTFGTQSERLNGMLGKEQDG